MYITVAYPPSLMGTLNQYNCRNHAYFQQSDGFRARFAGRILCSDEGHVSHFSTAPLEGRREGIDNELKELQLAPLFYLRYHPL